MRTLLQTYPGHSLRFYSSAWLYNKPALYNSIHAGRSNNTLPIEARRSIRIFKNGCDLMPRFQRSSVINGQRIFAFNINRSFSQRPDNINEEYKQKVLMNKDDTSAVEQQEKVLTIPNALTFARILGSPYIGYLIVNQQYDLALGGCLLFGLTDALDGYIARKFNMGSFVGSIIDPAADKLLMTVLTVSLSFSQLIPVPLAVIIVGRDVLLALAAFYIRWVTLPPPKTLSRYWDLSLPSVEVRPTAISKWNTAFQLLLMGTTLTVPVFGLPIDHWAIFGLQLVTGATTIASGIGYLVSRDAVHMLTKAEIAKKLKKTGSAYTKKSIGNH